MDAVAEIKQNKNSLIKQEKNVCETGSPCTKVHMVLRSLY